MTLAGCENPEFWHPGMLASSLPEPLVFSPLPDPEELRLYAEWQDLQAQAQEAYKRYAEALSRNIERIP